MGYISDSELRHESSQLVVMVGSCHAHSHADFGPPQNSLFSVGNIVASLISTIPVWIMAHSFAGVQLATYIFPKGVVFGSR